MSKTVIKIENLSKIYRLGEVGTGTLSHDLNRFVRMNILGQPDPYAKIGHVNDRTQKAEKGELVAALRDINLDVKQGEVLGIIGKNGAGKSTLLKLLSRVTSPTTGTIKIKGRMASLLEVGTGFHPEMTGRENIYMNGTIMGMRKWEIDKQLDAIVDFSGVAKYLDTPTKRYSSGMTVRLGFAIAAHLEPEILVVDEVLAVGDAEFQKKAIGKMQDVSTNDGRTVLFVSHNMSAVKNLCNNAILIETGEIKKHGETSEIIDNYLVNKFESEAHLNASQIEKLCQGRILRNNPTVKIVNIHLSDINKIQRNTFDSDEDIFIKTEVQVYHDIKDLRVIYEIVDKNNINILSTQVIDDLEYYNYQIKNKISPGKYTFETCIPKNTFAGKEYYLNVQVINIRTEQLILNNALGFRINFQSYNNIHFGNTSDSQLRPLFTWNFKKLESI